MLVASAGGAGRGCSTRSISFSPQGDPGGAPKPTAGGYRGGLDECAQRPSKTAFDLNTDTARLRKTHTAAPVRPGVLPARRLVEWGAACLSSGHTRRWDTPPGNVDKVNRQWNSRPRVGLLMGIAPACGCSSTLVVLGWRFRPDAEVNANAGRGPLGRVGSAVAAGGGSKRQVIGKRGADGTSIEDRRSTPLTCWPRCAPWLWGRPSPANDTPADGRFAVRGATAKPVDRVLV